MNCPKCGGLNPTDAAYCEHCGAELPKVTVVEESESVFDEKTKTENASYESSPFDENVKKGAEKVKAEGEKIANGTTVKEGKKIAWLSYIGLLFLIPFCVQPKNEFTRFHAKQGLTLFIFETLFTAATEIPLRILTRIELTLAADIISYCRNALNVGFLILAVIGVVNVINEKQQKLPLIGDIKIIKD